MILLFFLIPIIFAFLIIYLRSYLKWRENQKLISLVSQNKHQVFEQLKVSSLSYRKLKSIMGFAMKAKLFVTDDRLVITSERINILLFHTILPIIIEPKKATVSKIKATNWNTIQIAFQKETFSLGKATIELTIEAKDKEQQTQIYELIKDWKR